VLLDFAVKLTLQPWACEQSDIARLREAGWSDVAIHDATLVVAYFAFVNRSAEGLGVELEKTE
jgi:alkylhydroperoxidase family enzyme